MENIILANQQLNEWCGTEGINYYEGIEALGFLFKYAVPKVIKDYKLSSIHATWRPKGIWRVAVYYYHGVGSGEGATYALALFWAVYRVLKEAKE